MDGLPNWQVYGVPAVYIIVAVINWLKESFNLESKWAFPVATLLGAVVGTLMWLSDTYDWALTVTQIALGALLLGLSASGLYSNTKMYAENTTQREYVEEKAAERQALGEEAKLMEG